MIDFTPSAFIVAPRLSNMNVITHPRHRRFRLRIWQKTSRHAAAALLLSLASCAPYAVVKKKTPVFQPAALTTENPALTSAQQEIQRGQAAVQEAAGAELGHYLLAAKSAARELLLHPKDVAVRDTYNFAVGRVLGALDREKLTPWPKPLSVATSRGVLKLEYRPPPKAPWSPTDFDLVPADQFDFKGAYVQQHNVKAGLGAPLVVVGRGPNPRAEVDFSPPRIFYGVTATLRFEGDHAWIDLHDPLAKEEITFGRTRYPLAADFTAPMAVMLATTDMRKLELPRALRPERFTDTARLMRVQPYDPDKTIVVLIHGLMDSPATWTPMLNQLYADAEVRQHYQFWVFSYPSGYPYPYSADILRHELDRALKMFPTRKKIVLVGHSMGGCISRLLMTDSGDKIWNGVFSKPAEEMREDLPEDQYKALTAALKFKHRPEVGRAILLAAPLRGADMAGGLIGRIGANIITIKDSLFTLSRNAVRYVVGMEPLNRAHTSIDSLAPRTPFVKALSEIPPAREIPHHIICGDRGKGGHRDRSEPEMSDGFVPYWSSHLDTAASELIIPSNHSVQRRQETFDEVRRILLQYRR